MPITDAEHVVIEQSKLCDYLLNPLHPIGGAKASWFATLGYTQANWQDLQRDLMKLANNCVDFVVKSSPFGVKYELAGYIGMPDKRPGIVVSVWIIEGNTPPRLVTAYPGTTT
jgi:hypothetical protein